MLSIAIEALYTIAIGLLEEIKEEGEESADDPEDDPEDAVTEAEALDEEVDYIERLTAAEYTRPDNWEKMDIMERVVDIVDYYTNRGNTHEALGLIEPLGYTLAIDGDDLIIIKLT